MILFSLLSISMQVGQTGPCKTQPCSWILQNSINWQNPLKVVQGGVANKGLQEMLIYVSQDMAFSNLKSFSWIYVWGMTNFKLPSKLFFFSIFNLFIFAFLYFSNKRFLQLGMFQSNYIMKNFSMLKTTHHWGSKSRWRKI
jgi:hypothetical protein